MTTLRELVERLDALTAELAELREEKRPQRVPLSIDQKQELRVAWSRVVCELCGTVHNKTWCSRIREVRFHPNGTRERMLFWANGEWAPPEGAIRPEDVWDSGLAEDRE